MNNLTFSYIDKNEADEYFATRLGSRKWDQSSDLDKNRSLISATRLIDNLLFSGSKTSSVQPLEFPRNGSLEIPNDIKIATCEIAFKLLQKVDVDGEINNLYADSRSLANSRVGYDRRIPVEHIRAGIPSPIAWMYLRPYILIDNNVTLVRTS